MKKPLLLLWIISLAATATGMPYAFELQKEVLAQIPFPLPVLVLITLAQTGLLLAVAVFAGGRLANSLGLEIFALLGNGAPADLKAKVKPILKLGILAGAITGIAIFAADFVFAKFLTPQLSVQTAHPAVYKTLLASFYGGIVEEVLMRLFMVTLLAWLMAKIFRPTKPAENKPIMWTAIILAAILFGLGHLPVTAALTAVTPAIIARAIILNGIGGLIFGWLYWKKGLECAIVAHFTTDIVLLTILPAIF